ncbi:MAG TPA: tetratricopeptide repeat protein [Candidatus Limnocylindria bacterium]|nr:tetratricopeptide repeat protein [Candidatus Limnocylindria bacterium]
MRLAERARDHSPQPVAAIFSTLAGAYAEQGRFPEAIAACERAIALANASGESEEVRRFSLQLSRYRRGEPNHFES